LTYRNFLQRLPHTALECSAANVERKVQTDSGFLNESDDARNQSLIILISANQMRFRETILKFAKQSIRIIPEQNRCDPLFARCDQDCTERGLSEGEANFLVSPTCLELGRRHAEHVGRFLIEASTRIVTGVVDRLSDATASGKPLANPTRAMRSSIILRRKTNDRFEAAMEIAWTAAHSLGQGIQGWFLLTLLDKLACSRYERRILFFDRRSVRAASLARPETCSLRIRQRIVQLHVVWIGGSRRTRRPAIDTCRHDRVPK